MVFQRNIVSEKEILWELIAGFFTRDFIRTAHRLCEFKIQNSKFKIQTTLTDFALGEAIKQAKVGNRVGNISKTIQDIVEGARYSVVRTLVGHGVGRELHEEPEVPGFLAGQISKTPMLLEGMAIAIEVIYNMGKSDVIYANNDGWTIKTKDGSLSAVFERTVVVTEVGSVILTK
ncbi:MAG: M24 family metallopeptidase [Candidatus Levybacteria bacterium]|nr:M24 family metallopeptidase [Candidatus Levybacteria bacterium]